MKTLQNQIEDASLILIFSGEGERGTWEVYNGKDTVRAIKMRLTKERCGGDRWLSGCPLRSSRLRARLERYGPPGLPWPRTL
jgi:hypothetical protein